MSSDQKDLSCFTEQLLSESIIIEPTNDSRISSKMWEVIGEEKSNQPSIAPIKSIQKLYRCSVEPLFSKTVDELVNHYNNNSKRPYIRKPNGSEKFIFKYLMSEFLRGYTDKEYQCSIRFKPTYFAGVYRSNKNYLRTVLGLGVMYQTVNNIYQQDYEISPVSYRYKDDPWSMRVRQNDMIVPDTTVRIIDDPDLVVELARECTYYSELNVDNNYRQQVEQDFRVFFLRLSEYITKMQSL